MNIIESGKTAILERSYSERFFLIFWLLGPFILLIERSPADIWLTVLSLAFACRAISCRDGLWLRHFWVRAAFAFWSVCLLSSAAFQPSLNGFGEAFIWFRFPLFAMATAFWLGADKRILYLMFVSTALALLVMCSILLFELAIEGFKSRLSWPYDDLVPGNYLAKVGLPIVVLATALTLSSAGWTSLFFGSYCALIVGMALMTGERINLLLLLCAVLLTIFVLESNRKKRFVFYFIMLLIPVIIFNLFPSIFNRFIYNFLEQLPIYPGSEYYKAMMPAWLIFEQHPLLGIGPGAFRNFCVELVNPNLGLKCLNHPHNFYLQILSETGILGGITSVVFIGSIIFRCFKVEGDHRHIFYTVVWIIPFALFWPIKSSADFFGQWNNVFLWSAIALALAVSHLKSAVPK